MKRNLSSLLGWILGMSTVTDSKYEKSASKKEPAINSNNLQIQYRQVTPPTWGRRKKQPFRIPVVDATLSADNRILVKQIQKAASRGSKYIR